LKYLLDTNVCVDYLAGLHPKVVQRIQETHPAELATSSVVAAELRYGAEKSKQPARNHSRLDILLSELRCLEFDAEAAAAYGPLRLALERRGRTIGAHDLLIAAHALSTGLILVTDNVREFSRIQGLAVQNWRR